MYSTIIDYLTKEKVGIDNTTHMRPIMMNFKFHLIRSSPRILFNLTIMEKYLRAAKTKQDIQQNIECKCGLEQYLYEQDPASWEIYNNGIAINLPFLIREIKGPQDGKNMSFKFVCPTIHYANKKNRIIIFFRGKINI